MDAVSELPIAQIIPWTLAGLLLIVVVVLLVRSRKPSSFVDDAVLEAVYHMSKATPDLREGFDQVAADRITSQLLELLKCVAVGITDPEGTLASWDGEANDHYVDLTTAIGMAIRKSRREVVNHDDVPCDHRGTCKMKTAVIVPLIVDGEVEAALVVVGRSKGKRLVQMADAVAQFVCTQFELARLDESKLQLQQAEIKALRAQISPHFIYNALNTISSLIRTDPEEARELLQEFADFTRYSFRTSGMFTSLADELRNIDRYLTIERARFGGRLEVRLKIAPEVLSVVVPFLIIQPLVENAVQHGLASKPSGGMVTVTAQDYGSEALISVEDDGIGMDPARLADLRNSHRTGAHVGLGNINARMRQLFGDEYALMVETAPGAGMKVTLRVPKFAPGVRTELPDYSAAVPAQASRNGSPAHAKKGP
ncbi:GAF domain-containing sensor histidine kinase [Amycolatopsis alkalitolerans]|uniref:Sensor histidine kinase n=1 Tax=Amycolatopsis alkalitolerans TaxID=2547244 RepID=A0A5C4M391_9PSEU|nr:histidine kinase [Amycolatopsis alkalitolerans]TNC27481.1 sensor histidine kinase [Amycolatopsis alkalitolerans]